jgi:hypothetical protein
MTLLYIYNKGELNKMKCLKCKKKHNGNFGSGKYCSLSCANQRKFSEETKKKISTSLKKNDRKLYYWRLKEYTCEKCSQQFFFRNISKKAKKHCKLCRYNAPHNKDISKINSIYEFSKRTAIKILYRMDLMKCLRCGWKETTCDIHHILGRKIKNCNNHCNLTVLCPNCHRLVHNKKIDIEEIKKISLDKYLLGWEKYYLK